jgi:hypothetical protein
MIGTKGLKILCALFCGFGAYDLFVVLPTRTKPVYFKISHLVWVGLSNLSE